MTKLTNMQLVLLTAAAQRESGSALPFPSSVAEPVDGLQAPVKALLSRSLIEERPVRTAKTAWRAENDDRFGLFITDKGRAAINVEPADPSGAEGSKNEIALSAPAAKAERQTKSGLVVNLLQRSEGATLAELVAATGWQPHTTRAALTGLRKKSLTIEKSKREDATCYRITANA